MRCCRLNHDGNDMPLSDFDRHIEQKFNKRKNSWRNNSLIKKLLLQDINNKHYVNSSNNSIRHTTFTT